MGVHRQIPYRPDDAPPRVRRGFRRHLLQRLVLIIDIEERRRQPEVDQVEGRVVRFPRDTYVLGLDVPMSMFGMLVEKLQSINQSSTDRERRLLRQGASVLNDLIKIGTQSLHAQQSTRSCALSLIHI